MLADAIGVSIDVIVEDHSVIYADEAFDTRPHSRGHHLLPVVPGQGHDRAEARSSSSTSSDCAATTSRPGASPCSTSRRSRRRPSPSAPRLTPPTALAG
jgi:hypothetical protein